jgi:hypothetical protein
MIDGYLVRNVIVIHLGKNPNSGGMPLMDSSKIGIVREVYIIEIFVLLIVSDDVDRYIVMNSGIVMIEYISK